MKLLHAQVSAVLGDMERTAGIVRTTGSTAYVAQTAWIVNATVQGNITFGKPFDQARYDAVVEATSLEHDFKVRQQPSLVCTAHCPDTPLYHLIAYFVTCQELVGVTHCMVWHEMPNTMGNTSLGA